MPILLDVTERWHNWRCQTDTSIDV